MAQNVMMRAAPVTRRPRHWLRALWIGAVMFVLTTVVMFLTGNPNLYPTVILIGNFLIPVVFVTFLYDHQHLSSLTLPTIAQSFLIGGLLGTLGAAVLEPLLVPAIDPGQNLPISSALMIGLIEEGCKLAAVIFLARRGRHTSEMDGLLLGATVGMGFAALESTGYAFSAFLLSQGHVGASIASTLARGLLAPFGHGVWTATVGAVLFRESKPADFRLDRRVLLTYLFVSLLHGLWDGLPRTLFLVVPPGFDISVVSLSISVVGIVTLGILWRQALHQVQQPLVAEPIEAAPPPSAT
jgi:RsiW-degrading membrane proteinase PrsW (M82 family)